MLGRMRPIDAKAHTKGSNPMDAANPDEPAQERNFSQPSPENIENKRFGRRRFMRLSIVGGTAGLCFLMRTSRGNQCPPWPCEATGSNSCPPAANNNCTDTGESNRCSGQTTNECNAPAPNDCGANNVCDGTASNTCRGGSSNVCDINRCYRQGSNDCTGGSSNTCLSFNLCVPPASNNVRNCNEPTINIYP